MTVAKKWRDQIIRKSVCRWFAIEAVMAMSLGLAGCSDDSRASHEGDGDSGAAREKAGEHAMAEGAGEHAMAEGTGEHAMAEGAGEHASAEDRSEHGDAEEGRGHDEEGEESGVYIGAEETWDVTRRGVRLVLSFDAASNAFVGTVENVTRQTLCAVRVEVHLSVGTELGPTERTDLRPGETTAVRLPTAGGTFDAWTAHPETSQCSRG